MGGILVAGCIVCGYKSKMLLCGSGMVSWTGFMNKFPVYNPGMRGIKVEDLGLRDFILMCDPDMRFYNDPIMRHPADDPIDPSDRVGYSELLTGRFLCPSCKQYTLRFGPAGHWS